MRVVVDANVVAAALIRPDGWTADQLRRDDVAFLSPYTITSELDRNLDEFAEKADLAADEARGRAVDLVARLEVLGRDELAAVRDHPMVRKAADVDPDDAPYLAAVVAGGADLLWTRDRPLLEAFPGLAVAVVPEAGTG